MKIPKSFKLFATTYNVVFDNDRMNELGYYGLCSYSEAKITLSTMKGKTQLNEDRISDVFYHEKVHAILDMMNNELSNNEQFVDTFAKLLRQSDETSEYDRTEDDNLKELGAQIKMGM